MKIANFGREDGVACSMVDVFYVPGRLSEAFGWLALLTGKARTEVELAQATMWDMVAPRTEREHLRNVFRGGTGKAELEYSYKLHDWAHKWALSKNDTLSLAFAAVDAAHVNGLFYRPNISALMTRRMANDFY